MLIRRAKPGEPLTIRAADWNAIADAVAEVRRLVERGQGGALGGLEPWHWIKIAAEPTEVTADQKWTYECTLVRFDPSATGTELPLIEHESSLTYKAVNAWEELTLAGYEGESIGTLKPIPADAIVRAQMVVRGDEIVFVFSERNEPGCD